MIHRVLFLLVIINFTAIAHADQWYPWKDWRVVSPNGTYYVVMKRTGGPKVFNEWGPVEFTIAQRAAESPPVKPAESGFVTTYLSMDESGNYLPYEIKPNPDVRVRDGDKVLGAGKLERPPFAVIVSENGLGFAGLGVYGYNGYDNFGRAGKPSIENPDEVAVTIFSSHGNVSQRKLATELFTDKELRDFDYSAGGLHWLNYDLPGWIDEAKQQLVIVGRPSKAKPNRYLIRFLDWKTGKITNGPTLTSEEAVMQLQRKHLDASGIKNLPITRQSTGDGVNEEKQETHKGSGLF